jgi:iron complex outermembrane receptor protein
MQHPLSHAIAVALLATAATAALADVPAAIDTGPSDTAADELDAYGNPRKTPPTGSDSRDEPTWRGSAVEVTAKGTAADVPTALATDFVYYDDAIARPSDFQDFLTRVPGVGATGQNGVFETFSIRGANGNAQLNLFGGMPLSAQRRAGVPVSFVEPTLLGEIAVTRGPAVVHYGPGALGGAISVEPRWFDGGHAEGGYATSGDEWMVTGGYGNEAFSVGVARHQAGESESADGTPLNTDYDRVSAVVQGRVRFGEFELDGMLAPSRTEDIGKSNSRFPARDTFYPEDTHNLGRVRLRHDAGFEATFAGHEQYLGTVNTRPGFATTFVGVQSDDYDFILQQTFESGEFTTNVGMEYFWRRGVDAYDATRDLSVRRYTLQNGREDTWSLFAITDWAATEHVSLEFGARHSSLEQEFRGAEADDGETAVTAGWVWSPVEAHRVSLNVASGYRFATLEERYFSGVTPQGEVVGNANLTTESSLAVDLGHAWVGETWRTEFHLWHNDVDDLITLTAVAPGVNGFTNVGEATLWGAEGVIGWTPTDALALRASGTLVRSNDETTDDPLFGSPPVTTHVEARYRFTDAWSAAASWEHRFAMDRPGFEEVARDSVDLVGAEVRWRPVDDVELQFYARNLFDEDYYATADALSALGEERSFGINVAWSIR